MKESLRRALALLVAVIMVTSCMPLTALAQIIEPSGSVQLYRAIQPDQGVYVTFEFYNGDEKVDTQIVKNGEGTVTAPATPQVPEGKKFEGWYTDEGLFVPGMVTGYTASTTIRVNARYSDVFYVYFQDVEGNVFRTLEATAENGYKVTPPTDYEPRGARVDSWKAGNAKFTADTVVTADTYVMPETIPCYWVTFNTLGGTGIASRYVDQGKTLNLDSVGEPTRSGYTFEGWSTSADGSDVVASVRPTDDTTLYAVWKGAEVQYTIVYWGENADDEEYSVLATAQKMAKAGTQVTENNATLPWSFTERNYFTFERSDTVTVAANGHRC